jgi:hypothetical protein
LDVLPAPGIGAGGSCRASDLGRSYHFRLISTVRSLARRYTTRVNPGPRRMRLSYDVYYEGTSLALCAWVVSPALDKAVNKLFLSTGQTGELANEN